MGKTAYQKIGMEEKYFNEKGRKQESIQENRIIVLGEDSARVFLLTQLITSCR